LTCIKTIIFFDPESPGLSDKQRIKSLRHQVHMSLEDYINDRQFDSRGRLGEILLLLPNLQSITRQMIEQIQYAKFNGQAKTDNLIDEILLGGIGEFQQHNIIPSGIIVPTIVQQADQNNGISTSPIPTSMTNDVECFTTMANGSVIVCNDSSPSPPGSNPSITVLSSVQPKFVDKITKPTEIDLNEHAYFSHSPPLYLNQQNAISPSVSPQPHPTLNISTSEAYALSQIS